MEDERSEAGGSPPATEAPSVRRRSGARIGVITVHFEQYRRFTRKVAPVIYDRSRVERVNWPRLPAHLLAFLKGRRFDRRHGWHRIQIPWLVRHSSEAVRVYVYANDVAPATLRYISRFPRVTVMSGAFDPRGLDAVTQHGRGLEVAANRAAAECDYLLSLDNDSFPARPDWEEVLLRNAESFRMTAVCRREFLKEGKKDALFPHPCGIFLESAAWRELGLSFMPYPPSGTHPRVVAPGVLIGLEFRKRNWPWLALEKSNCREFAPRLATVYGDLIYHHGGGSRTTNFAITGGRRIDHTAERNRLQVRLQENPEAFIAHLRGEPERVPT